MQINTAREVREAIDLSPTEAGRLFTGNNKRPYDIWKRWEETGNWPAPVDKMFKIILTLKMCEEVKTPGASKALKIVLDTLSLDDD